MGLDKGTKVCYVIVVTTDYPNPPSPWSYDLKLLDLKYLDLKYLDLKYLDVKILHIELQSIP